MSNCESCFLSLQDKHRFKLCIWTHRRQIDDRSEKSTYFGEWSFIIRVVPITYSNIYPTRCNFTQFVYIWKLLYMFRVVTPPIIRSAYNCIYSIWYVSHRYCYLECAVGGIRHPQHTHTCSTSSTIAADSSNGVTNTRCCRYSCMRSWWWAEVSPETCRSVSRYK
jgi:hypothetical protein